MEMIQKKKKKSFSRPRAGKEKKKKVHAHSMTKMKWMRRMKCCGSDYKCYKMNNMEEENHGSLTSNGAAGLSDGQQHRKLGMTSASVSLKRGGNIRRN